MEPHRTALEIALDPVVWVGQGISFGWLLLRLAIMLGFFVGIAKLSGLDWKEKIVPEIEASPVAAGILFGLLGIAGALLLNGR